MDADDSVENTGRAISHCLEMAGIAPPQAVPADGFVGESGEYRARVGVWLMPDNRQEGMQGKETLEEPRLPYGTAIKAGYFRHDSPVAERTSWAGFAGCSRVIEAIQLWFRPCAGDGPAALTVRTDERVGLAGAVPSTTAGARSTNSGT